MNTLCSAAVLLISGLFAVECLPQYCSNEMGNNRGCGYYGSGCGGCIGYGGYGGYGGGYGYNGECQGGCYCDQDCCNAYYDSDAYGADCCSNLDAANCQYNNNYCGDSYYLSDNHFCDESCCEDYEEICSKCGSKSSSCTSSDSTIIDSNNACGNTAAYEDLLSADDYSSICDQNCCQGSNEQSNLCAEQDCCCNGEFENGCGCDCGCNLSCF